MENEEEKTEDVAVEEARPEKSPFFWGNPDLVVLDDDGAPA